MNQRLLSIALSLFRADPLPAERLSGGTFSEVYQFSAQGVPYILRLTPPGGGIDPRDMASILDFMRHLAEGGLTVPRPLASQHNRLVEEITADENTWLATAVQKAPGVRAETLAFEAWDDKRLNLLGQLTGRLHRLSQGYQPSPGVAPRPEWDQLTNNFNRPEEMPTAEEDILRRREDALQKIARLPKSAPTFGMIHADLQFANFFIDTQTDTLTLFDFDDCCYGWYLMDIALPLLDMLVLYPGQDRAAFARRFMEQFMRGYGLEREIPPEHLAKLPQFLKLLEIGLYLQVAGFADKAPADSWVGKFMRGRRENILTGGEFVIL